MATPRARRPQELAKIRDDLAQPETRPTLAAIAEAANAKGLRTGRGNPWSASAVSQALARLGDSASDDAQTP